MAGAGAGTSNGSLADPPMPSMAEFTQQMKEDAENQQCLVPIVAKLLAKLVEENDKLPADKEITVFHAQKAPAVNDCKILVVQLLLLCRGRDLHGSLYPPAESVAARLPCQLFECASLDAVKVRAFSSTQRLSLTALVLHMRQSTVLLLTAL
eukprot:104955-Rhodomonas_salina.2